MKKLFYSTFCFLLFSVAIFAQKNGGMWVPNELNEAEMKELGLEISVDDIFNTTRPSIKDAIVQFGGGCTGEIISSKGLVLTNHHCGYGSIQFHSSVENDLLSNGFWANNMKEELPTPGLSVTIVVDIKKITDKILKNLEGLSYKEQKDVITKNIEQFKESYPKESYQNISVKPMYAGNEYYAFISETYNDVRLVGAPPQSIGKFGSDTDNWAWPRHTGDFSMFRIYVDKNNQPSAYSPDNVPYKPKYHLAISTRELKEGDFTFIFGYPGHTSEYLPSVAIKQIVEDINPIRIGIRDLSLKILDQKMREDNAIRIKYAAKYAGISNAWKKWQGESKGLRRSNAVQAKRTYEMGLAQRNRKIGHMLVTFEQLYESQKDYAVAATLLSELFRNSETLYLARLYHTIYSSYNAGTLDEETTGKIKSKIRSIYKNFDKELDAKVTASVVAFYADNIKRDLLPDKFMRFENEAYNQKTFALWQRKSIIVNTKNDLDMMFSDMNYLVKKLKKDNFFRFYNDIIDAYYKNVDEKYSKIQDEIDLLQKDFMAEQMKTDKNKVFFPDANFTLRVSYGKIMGSKPADGIYYNYQTTFDGVIEKYIPGDYEFNVPDKLIRLYNNSDFGSYTNKDGKVPVCFTATNHTTGGNSGSPALDAKGNLIGLNFDRQWEGTMSDIYFDPELCRNIMVDARYILFIIDKFAEARWLLDEMTIIRQ